MKGPAKFFTPPLASRSKTVFLDCLGLGQTDYLFLEVAGTHVVRSKRMRGSIPSPSLAPSTAEEALAVTAAAGVTLLARRWGQPGPLKRPLSLWEELFPYPLSLLGGFFEGDQDIGLWPHPPSFRFDWEVLWQAFRSLEERLCHTEVSCLWLRSRNGELPLLFQYVRGKRVRVGTSPDLAPLLESARQGIPDSEALRAYFGTFASFFRLDLESIPEGPAGAASGIKALIEENPGPSPERDPSTSESVVNSPPS